MPVKGVAGYKNLNWVGDSVLLLLCGDGYPPAPLLVNTILELLGLL
jgi:hypothetical protein